MAKEFCRLCGESVQTETGKFANPIPDNYDPPSRKAVSKSLLEGNFICADCREQLYFDCADCDIMKSKEEAYQLDGGGAVCDDCYSSGRYQSCDRCAYYFPPEKVSQLCAGCLRNHCQEEHKKDSLAAMN